MPSIDDIGNMFLVLVNRSGRVPVFPTPLVPRTPILSGRSPAAEQDELPPFDMEVTLACA